MTHHLQHGEATRQSRVVLQHPRDLPAVILSHVVYPQNSFVREEKNKRKLKSCVELTCCAPAACRWAVSRGQGRPQMCPRGQSFPLKPRVPETWDSQNGRALVWQKSTGKKTSFTVMALKFSESSFLVFPSLKQKYFITAKNVFVPASHGGLWYYIASKMGWWEV